MPIAHRLKLGELTFSLKQPACLFKEKINYKLPGGGGYKAHQDGYRGLGVPQGPYEFMAYGACALTATARPARLTAAPPARSVHDRGR